MSSHFVPSTGSADGGAAQIDRAAFSKQPEVLCPKEGQQLSKVLSRRMRVTQGEVQLRKVSLCLVA